MQASKKGRKVKSFYVNDEEALIIKKALKNYRKATKAATPINRRYAGSNSVIQTCRQLGEDEYLFVCYSIQEDKYAFERFRIIGTKITPPTGYIEIGRFEKAVNRRTVIEATKEVLREHKII
jgi:hypothetical protein